MTIFSPVSSARYRRSSVSINPSCPSQVSVFNSDDAFTVLPQSVICRPSSSSSSCSSSLSLHSPWLETDSTRRGRWEQKEFRLVLHNVLPLWFHCEDTTNHTRTSVMFSQSVQSERGYLDIWRGLTWLCRQLAGLKVTGDVMWRLITAVCV